MSGDNRLFDRFVLFLFPKFSLRQGFPSFTIGVGPLLYDSAEFVTVFVVLLEDSVEFLWDDFLFFVLQFFCEFCGFFNLFSTVKVGENFVSLKTHVWDNLLY